MQQEKLSIEGVAPAGASKADERFEGLEHGVISERPGPVRTWIHAARPPTLPAAIVPVLVGTALGVHQASFHLLPFLAALVASILIQVGVNYANDYSDFHKGTDTEERVGPVRITSSGLVTPEQVKRAIIIVFGLAALIGLYLVAVGGWPILVVGVASILAALAYTGGPWPFGYHGLGDLFVFIFFGLVAVTGSAYLQTGRLSWAAAAAAVPVGLLVTNILVINNLRDLATDRATGKRTLAVIIGPQHTRMQYALFAFLPYLLPPLLVIFGAAHYWALLPWLTLPLAARMVGTVLGGMTGRSLNRVLKLTGQLHLLFGILFALGLLL